MNSLSKLLLGLLLFTVPAIAAERLTLNHCIQTALSHNQNLKALDLKLDVAQKQIENAQMAYYPRLDLNSYYSYISEVAKLTIGPISKDQGDHDAMGLSGNISEMLFDGGQALNRIHTMKLNRESSMFSRQSTADDLALNVGRLFYGIAGLEKVLATFELEEQTLLDTRKDVQNRLNAGLQLPVDVLAIDLQVASLQNRIEDLSNSIRMTKLRLASLMGVPNDSISAFQTDEITVPGQSALVVFMPERRASLQTISKQIQAGEYRIKSQRGTFLPMITAKGSYFYDNPGIDKMNSNWMNYWTVGIILNWSLWDFNIRSRDLKAAKMETQALKDNLDFATDQARLQFDEANLNSESSRRQIRLSEQQVNLAQQKLDKTRDKYNSGLATSSELITAVNDWESAKLTQAKNMIQSRLNELELKYAMGDILK